MKNDFMDYANSKQKEKQPQKTKTGGYTFTMGDNKPKKQTLGELCVALTFNPL